RGAGEEPVRRHVLVEQRVLCLQERKVSDVKRIRKRCVEERVVGGVGCQPGSPVLLRQNVYAPGGLIITRIVRDRRDVVCVGTKIGHFKHHTVAQLTLDAEAPSLLTSAFPILIDKGKAATYARHYSERVAERLVKARAVCALRERIAHDRPAVRGI